MGGSTFEFLLGADGCFCVESPKDEVSGDDSLRTNNHHEELYDAAQLVAHIDCPIAKQLES